MQHYPEVMLLMCAFALYFSFVAWQFLATVTEEMSINAFW